MTYLEKQARRAGIDARPAVEIEPWPNGLGFEATVNGERYSVWNDGRVQHLVADPDSVTGWAATHWWRRDPVRNPRSHALAVDAAWRRGPHWWTPCEVSPC